MWKILPAPSVTRTDIRLRACGAACSTILAAVSAVRISGCESTTRLAAIGVSAVQPFGASEQSIVLQACLFATSSATDAPNIDIVSPPLAGAGRAVAGVVLAATVSGSPAPPATSVPAAGPPPLHLVADRKDCGRHGGHAQHTGDTTPALDPAQRAPAAGDVRLDIRVRQPIGRTVREPLQQPLDLVH